MEKEKTVKTCFVIAPIGEEGSPERARSNQVLKHVISPVAADCGYKLPVVRADEISRPGLITNQIIEHLLNDDLVVADLTGKNANVFYELAIRHAIRKPMVQLIQAGEVIPFDVSVTRTISLDHHDLDSVATCKEQLKGQIRAVESDPTLVDTPLSVVVDLQASRGSQNPVEKILLQLMDRVNELSFRLRDIDRAERLFLAHNWRLPRGEAMIDDLVRRRQVDDLRRQDLDERVRQDLEERMLLEADAKATEERKATLVKAAGKDK